jgi:Sec7-like guanine-nucleotide exchange factor
MDTAFKRRWNFSYLGIDDNEANLVGKRITLGKEEFAHTIEWNALRKSLNHFLADKGINEDKQIGPYFLSREVSIPDEGDQIAPEPFVDAFQQKVLMYLFEDAARHHRASLFAGCDHKGNRYSNVRSEFVRKGMHIFNQQIVDSVPTTSTNAPIDPNSTSPPGTG